TWFLFFFFQAEDGIRDRTVTGVQTCALPISPEIVVDRLRQLRARGTLALDFRGQACERLAQLARLAVALRHEPRELGLQACELRSEERRVGREWRCRGEGGGCVEEGVSVCGR